MMRALTALFFYLLLSNAHAITLCVPKATGDEYVNSPSCVKGMPWSEEQSSFGAVLQPQLEQTQLGHMGSSQYRYIDFPVSESYSYQLYDGPIKTAKSVIQFTPLVEDKTPKLKVQFPSTFAYFVKELLEQNKDIKCELLSEGSVLCNAFKDYLTLMAPIFKLNAQGEMWRGFQTIEAFKEPAIKVSVNDGGEPYLSVRYVSICSGQVIRSDLFMTAGHCMVDGDATTLKLNSINRNNVVAIGNNWQTTKKLSFIDQDKFNSSYIPLQYFNPADPQDSKQDVSFDVALIPLKTPITDATPVVLTSKPLSQITTQTYVAGFGMTEPFINERQLPIEQAAINKLLAHFASPQLLYGVASFVKKEVCTDNNENAGFKFAGLGFDKLVCAGKAKLDSIEMSEVSFCEGDSGGPLFFKAPTGEYTLVGTVSRKSGLCKNLINSESGTYYPSAGMYAPISNLCGSDFFKSFDINCQ